MLKLLIYFIILFNFFSLKQFLKNFFLMFFFFPANFFILNMNLNISNKCSMIMMILTFFLWLLVILNFFKSNKMNEKKFIFSMFFLFFSLLFFFSVQNFLLFFLFFEMSIIPILFILLGWGYQMERLQATIYLMIYMFFSSFPLLLFFIFFIKESLNMSFLFMTFNLIKISLLFFFFLILPFLVKLPSYFFHLWLPKAHVEAPVMGSVILAGIMLKMGGYALFKINYFFFFNLFICIFLLLGFFLSSILCLFQSDMKSLIAFSSINHMTFLSLSMLSKSLMGMKSLTIIMLGHGIVSSSLFLYVDSKFSIFSNRIFYYLSGGGMLFVSLFLGLLLLSSLNFSVPPSINWLGEVFLIISTQAISQIFILILFFSFFFSCCLSIYLFCMGIHSKTTQTSNILFKNYFFLLLFIYLFFYLCFFFLGEILF